MPICIALIALEKKTFTLTSIIVYETTLPAQAVRISLASSFKIRYDEDSDLRRCIRACGAPGTFPG